MFDESAGRRERLVGNSIPSVLGSFGRTAFRMLSEAKTVGVKVCFNEDSADKGKGVRLEKCDVNASVATENTSRRFNTASIGSGLRSVESCNQNRHLARWYAIALAENIMMSSAKRTTMNQN